MDTLLKWPNQLFERLIVVGLSTSTDPEQLVQEVVKDGNEGQTYSPEVLYSHSVPGSSFSSTNEFVAAFCFPYGVLSEVIPLDASCQFIARLNSDDINGQGIIDKFSVFMIKAAGQPEFPVYGVCCYTMDLQQRKPAAAQQATPAEAADNTPPALAQQQQFPSIRVQQGGGEYLVRAPRCYCLLSHYPFFELHYHTLQMIIKLEKQQLLAELQQQLADLLQPDSQDDVTAAATATLDLGIATPRGDAAAAAAAAATATAGADDSPRSAPPQLDINSRPASFAAGSSDHTLVMQKLAALRARLQQQQKEGGSEGSGSVRSREGGDSPGRGGRAGDPYQATLQRYLEAGPGQGRQAGQGEQDSGCEQSDFSDLQSSSDVSDQESDTTSPRAELRVERSLAGLSLSSINLGARPAMGIQDWAAQQQALLQQLAPQQQEPESPTSPKPAALGVSRLASVTDRTGSFSGGGPQRSSMSITSKAGEGAAATAAAAVQRSGMSATQMAGGGHGHGGVERSAHSSSLLAAAAALRAEHSAAAGKPASARMTEMSPRLAAIQNSLVSRPARPAADASCDTSPPSTNRATDSVGSTSVLNSARSAAGSLGGFSLKGRAQALLQQVRGSKSAKQQQQQQQQDQASASDLISSEPDSCWSSQEQSPDAFSQRTDTASPGRDKASTAAEAAAGTARDRGPQPTSKADPLPARIANVITSYASIAIDDIHPSCNCLVFCPDMDLRGMRYVRPEGPYQRRGCHYPVLGRATKVLQYAEEEMADSLRHWGLASLCRTLSLDNILLLLSCVLRECQVLVLCPILSKLSSCLLGLLPLLQPFAWHHLHLPVVPLAPLALQPGQPPRVLGFQLLQATCPFLLGFPVTDQEALFAMCEDSEQSDELRDMLPNLVVAQLLEDCVSLGQGVAHVALPGCKGLRAQLAPLHERLAGYAGEYEARALHLISREERDAAEEMLGIIRRYLDATLAPQQPPEAPASGASSVCSEPLALPSPRSASGLTGRLRSFFGGDEERARFWQSFGQTAMVAQYSI